MIARLTFLCIALCAAGCDPDDPPSDDSNTGGSGMVSGSGGSGGRAGSGMTGGTAGSSGSGGSSGSSGMMPACNTLALGDAPDVGFTYVLEDPPEPLGGEITDGTYVITEIIAYQLDLGITDPFARVRLVVSGNTWQEVDGFPMDDLLNPPRNLTSTMSIDGPRITVTRSCPSVGAPESGTFTVTPEGFTLYVVDAGITVGNVFTKQ